VSAVALVQEDAPGTAVPVATDAPVEPAAEPAPADAAPADGDASDE